MTRSWSDIAIACIEADFARSADTHLVALPLSGGVDLFFKDESTHPSGSLKHIVSLAHCFFTRSAMAGCVRYADHCNRSLFRFNSYQRSLFRPPARPPVYRCRAGLHRPREARPDRVL